MKKDVFSVSALYTIGTKVRIRDDDPGVIHEVYGYEWFADGANIIFKDGGRLNLKRLELIEEVVR